MELFKHQKEAVDFANKNNGSIAVFFEMGLGKTRIGLEIFASQREKNPDLKLLVVSPISLIESAWEEDTHRFTGFTFSNLRKTNDISDVNAINYEAFLSKDRFDFICNFLIKYQTMAILDESSRLKNFKALTTKRVLSIRDLCQKRVVMSGTPAPNSPTEYWAQISFVNPYIFPNSFYKFRNENFHLARGGEVLPQGKFMTREMAREIFSSGWKYSQTPAQNKRMMEKILTCACFAYKSDCLDLPEEVDEIRVVEMGAKQSRYYRQMKNDLITEIQGSDVSVTVALARIMKLRQITSGFAISDDDKAVELEENPKLAELPELIEQAGKQQIIIWAVFHHDIEKIHSVLGDKSAMLYGKTSNPDEVIANFKEGKIQYLIAHPRSAGYGHTFINCCLEIFYSLDYSWESYQQSRARIHRAGQKNKCTYVHIIAKDSIDETIIDVLHKKGAANEVVHLLVGGFAQV